MTNWIKEIPDTIEYKELVLEKAVMVLRDYYSVEMLSGIDIYTHDTAMKTSKLIEWVVKLPFEPLGYVTKNLTYELPKNWWQYFKLQHLPTLAKYRPVRYMQKTVSFDLKVQAFYPKLKKLFPKDAKEIRFQYLADKIPVQEFKLND